MTRTAVLAYYKYVGGPDSQTVYGTRYFCGACSRGISGVYGGACYGRPEYPEDLERENEQGFPEWNRERGSLEYYAFCPWCGAEFEDEWWKGCPIQNERAIDHYQQPGTHKGDTHEFHGFEPVGHWLSSTDGHVCWCDPVIEPGLLGCVIRHRDVART